MLADFEPGGPAASSSRGHGWFCDTGVSYLVGVDGISVFMVALTALLFPIGLLVGTAIDRG